MKLSLLLSLPAVVSAFVLAAPVARAKTQAPATVGKTAPGFSLKAGDGKTHGLEDYKGKIVVLEWTNPQCPFVQKFYDSGAMQKFQKEAHAKGVVWLRVNSGAPGKQGAQDAAQIATYDKAHKVAATASLLDPEGTVGHLYGARNTPFMAVIDAKGTLAYAGGIDDKPSAKASDIPGAKNYVNAAIDELLADKPVAVPTAAPYGCGIKYAH